MIEKPGERKRNSIENLIHVVKYKFWSNDLGETHNPVMAEGGQDDEGGGEGEGAGGDTDGAKDESGHDSYIEAMFAGVHTQARIHERYVTFLSFSIIIFAAAREPPSSHILACTVKSI